jgi:ribosomal protein S20
MSRSKHSNRNRSRTAFNKALKSDNRTFRRKCNEFTEKVSSNLDIFDEGECPILREVSNPWNYD